jgi:hypothetical protein
MAFTLLIGVAIVASVLFSLEPAGSRIIGISTPYKKSGLLFTKYENHFDKNDDDTLCHPGPQPDDEQRHAFAGVCGSRHAGRSRQSISGISGRVFRETS